MNVRELFVAEPATAAVRRPAEPRPAPATGRTAVLLAASADAGPLGALLALSLARRPRSAVALLLGWHAPTRLAGPPGTPAAARTVRTLTAHGAAASASGRLVRVVLPDDEAQAVATTTRTVSAAPVAAPVVIALGGPRGDGFEDVVAGADLVVVAGPADDARTTMALAGVAPIARRTVHWSAPPTPARRRLAAAGIAVAPGASVPPEALR